MSEAADLAPEVTLTIAQRFALANLEAIEFGLGTKLAVAGAEPHGELVILDDGTPALRVDGELLGAMPDAGTVARTFGPLTSNEDTVMVVFGLGVGHAAREMRARSNAQIIIYEPDPGIVRAVLELGPTDLGGTVIVTELADLDNIWLRLAGTCTNASVIVSPGYVAMFPAAFDALREAIPRHIAEVDIVENTRALRYPEWISNHFANVTVLTQTSPILTPGKKFEGVPGFIVGAGPSLAKNAALLHQASKKGIVIAVDVAGKALAQMGVEPHVLVCLEGLNLSHHMAHLPFIDTVVRAFSLSAHPRSLATGSGPLLPFFESIREFQSLADLCGVPGVSVGGSVSTVAFSIAQMLGCSTIVLIGQDLAYSGGRTHAAGSSFEHSRVTVDEATGKVTFAYCDEIKRARSGSALGSAPATDDLYMVEGYGGEGRVASTSSFNSFRAWFEFCAQTLHQIAPDTKLINATEGGSRIAHYEEHALADVLARMPDVTIDIPALFAEAARPHRTRAQLDEWMSAIIARSSRVRRIAARIEAACERALRDVDQGSNAAAQRQFGRIDALERELSKSLRAERYLQAWAHARIKSLTDRTERSHTVDLRDEAKWSLRAEKNFASALAASAKELETELKSSLSQSSKTSTPSGD